MQLATLETMILTQAPSFLIISAADDFDAGGHNGNNSVTTTNARFPLNNKGQSCLLYLHLWLW